RARSVSELHLHPHVRRRARSGQGPSPHCEPASPCGSRPRSELGPVAVDGDRWSRSCLARIPVACGAPAPLDTTSACPAGDILFESWLGRDCYRVPVREMSMRGIVETGKGPAGTLHMVGG